MKLISTILKNSVPALQRTHCFAVSVMNRLTGTRLTLTVYRGADKSLARPVFGCILFDGENISFDASLVIYINSTNIPPIMIINRVYENENFLSL